MKHKSLLLLASPLLCIAALGVTHVVATVTTLLSMNLRPVHLNSNIHAPMHKMASRMKNVGKYKANWPRGREEAC